MNKLEEDLIEQEIRDHYLEQGEAVMREMLEDEEMSSINDLPAFPPASLTKSKAEELLAEIEKAKNPLTTYLKNKGGSEE